MVDLLHAIVHTRVTTIVLLSHKLVANVLQHYELLCMLPPKRNTFFFYTMTAIFTRDRTGSCFVSKLYSSTRSCINSQGQFYISPFVNK